MIDLSRLPSWAVARLFIQMAVPLFLLDRIQLPVFAPVQRVILIKGEIQLKKVPLEEARQFWQMQRLAFSELLERYQDTQTNPACETLERVRSKMAQPGSFFYWIKYQFSFIFYNISMSFYD